MWGAIAVEAAKYLIPLAVGWIGGWFHHKQASKKVNPPAAQ
jgi:hypothetical protein